jgi:IMP dehydrogenase
MRESLTYDDALLLPQYSEVESRSEVDLEQTLSDSIKLRIPIISSPMDTVTEKDMVIALDEMGALGVLHRYLPLMKQAELAYHCNKDGAKNIGAAIGVTNDYLVRAEALVNIGHVNVLCVDVAHGHHVMVERALKSLKDKFGDKVHLMAGNVATLEAFNDLADWGADSIRCGIGGGSICTTRIQTGHGVPGLATIFECAESDRDAKIIADGGIKNSGDIVKALAAGADFVMLGSLVAGTAESPGQLLSYTDGSKRKAYRGMASRAAQKAWRGKASTAEGVASTVHYKGNVNEVINNLVGGIKSGCSYSGARSLHELRTSAKWTRQSAASMAESLPHILGKC